MQAEVSVSRVHTHLFNATDVLDDCLAGLMLAYGSKGPLLRRFIISAG